MIFRHAYGLYIKRGNWLILFRKWLNGQNFVFVHAKKIPSTWQKFVTFICRLSTRTCIFEKFVIFKDLQNTSRGLIIIFREWNEFLFIHFFSYIHRDMQLPEYSRYSYLRKCLTEAFKQVKIIFVAISICSNWAYRIVQNSSPLFLFISRND